jgi:hypothetical protein
MDKASQGRTRESPVRKDRADQSTVDVDDTNDLVALWALGSAMSMIDEFDGGDLDYCLPAEALRLEAVVIEGVRVVFPGFRHVLSMTHMDTL